MSDKAVLLPKWSPNRRIILAKGQLDHSYRGCSIFIWTGLNIKIGIVQKVYEWSNCPFAKMIFPWGDHFGKRTALLLIYFLNYAYLAIWPSLLFFGYTLYKHTYLVKKNWELSLDITFWTISSVNIFLCSASSSGLAKCLAVLLRNFIPSFICATKSFRSAVTAVNYGFGVSKIIKFGFSRS